MQDEKQILKQLKKQRENNQLDSYNSSQNEQKIQNQDDDQQYSEQDESDNQDNSSGWSSEVVQPAIKSMSFRQKRGTRMKDLIKGKQLRKDLFWEKYQNYFGGDINQAQQQDEEDYEASSSGRDQFDSDFDLTDSYVGKRGRKKGTKVKRRKNKAIQKQQKVVKQKGKRGRKKKMNILNSSEQSQDQVKQLKTNKAKLIQLYLKMQIKMQLQIDLVLKADRNDFETIKPEDIINKENNENISTCGERQIRQRYKINYINADNFDDICKQDAIKLCQ